MTPKPTERPEEDGSESRFESTDTIVVVVDGPGDTTVRPLRQSIRNLERHGRTTSSSNGAATETKP